MKTLAFPVLAAAVIGLAQPSFGAESVEVEHEVDVTFEHKHQVNDEKPREIRKEIHIERREPGGKARIEERNGDDVVIRTFGGEGAPAANEKRVERFEGNAPAPQPKRRILRDQANVEEDVIIRRAPARPQLRAEARRPRPPRAAAAPRSSDRAEHIEQAIRHLREAGLPEMADRLEPRLEEFRAAPRPVAPPAGNVGAELERLKREHRKLQQQLRQIQQRLDAEQNAPREKQ